MSVFCAQPGDLSAEPHLAAQVEDAPADILHHRQQHIGAHMGLGIIEDVLSGPCRHELLQNPLNPGIIDAGVQLAVGKGTCAALAELDVTARIQRASCEKGLHLFMPGSGVLAPLQHQRLLSRHGEDQRRKHPRRPKAHHHRPQGGRLPLFGRAVEGNRRHGRPLAGRALQNLVFAALHRHIHGVDDFHIRLFSGIHAAADDPQAADAGCGKAQHSGCFKLELTCAVLRGHDNVPQSDHFVSLPALRPASLPELQAHCKL